MYFYFDDDAKKRTEGLGPGDPSLYPDTFPEYMV